MLRSLAAVIACAGALAIAQVPFPAVGATGQALSLRFALGHGRPVYIDVEGKLGADVRVYGVKNRNTLDLVAQPDDALIGHVQVRQWAASDGVHIAVERRPGDQPSWFWQRHDVHVSVHLPADTTLTLSAVNGPIHVDSVTAPLTVNLVNGPISVENAGAVLSLKTVNGPITAEVTEMTRTPAISLQVTNGPIQLTVPHGFRAIVDAHAMMGPVDDGLTHSDGPGRVDAHVVTGPITLSES